MSYRSRTRRTVAILAVLAGLAAIATPAFSEAPESGHAPTRFERHYEIQRELAAEGIERQLRLARWKLGFVGVALAVWVAAIVRPPKRPRVVVAKRVALGVLALLSIASFYRFSFSDRVDQDMHIKDVYHYYIGGKYFAEMGYGRLYACTLTAASLDAQWWVAELDSVRDLETMQPRPAREILETGRRECRSRFSDERWAAFSQDLRFFFDRVDGPLWRGMLLDHGFNPSPVWTWLAKPIAESAPAEGLLVLVHLDTLLVLAAIGAVGWAFGFEALCLVAIVWGTGFPWRYTWVGDAFLRQVWFATALLGVACLGRRRDALAGALLAVSAGVRLFPAVFAAGVGLRAIVHFARDRSWPAGTWRFAAGLAAAVLVLGVGAGVATDRGVDDYADFFRNTVAYREIASVNMAGVPALLWRIDGTSDLRWSREMAPPSGFRISTRMSRVVQGVAALGALLLFAAATRYATSWEAAAAAFALIPVLAAPAGYYFHFCALAAVLAVRRPWIGVWLLVACGAWLVNGLVWRPLAEQYSVVSIVAVALSVAVLASMLRPASDEPAPGPS